MKKWFEEFAKENKIDAAKVEASIKLFEDEISKLKTANETALNELKTKLKQSEEKSVLSAKKTEEILAKFGLKDGEGVAAKIDEFLANKDKTGDDKLKILENKINELSIKAENERKAKLEAIKKSELSKLIDGVKNLNPDHKEIVEIKLANALKIDDNAKVYFESESGAVETKGYLDEFFKNNEKYILSAGSAGSGNGSGYAGGTQKKFSEMSLTEKGLLFKQNPQEYERLKNG